MSRGVTRPILNEQTFVFDHHTYSFAITQTNSVQSSLVRVKLDGFLGWSREIPSWKALSFGVSAGIGFFWSARELIELPSRSGVELEVIEVDEDILTPFRVEDGWVLVCETSIRRVVSRIETARVLLRDVVESTNWVEHVLNVRDSSGGLVSLKVENDQLLEIGDRQKNS